MDQRKALLWLLVSDFGLQWACFVISALYKTEKFFDLVGSLSFFGVAVASLCMGGDLHERQVMVTTLVSVWAVRLGTFLLLRVLRVGKDSRFDKVREAPLQLFVFWNIQAVWVFVVSLPVMLANLSPANPPWLGLSDILGMTLWGVGFLAEAVADYQKHVFRENDANEGKWIESGLWGISRHPNYLGEMLVWSGVFLLSSSALQGPALLAGLLSPVFVAFLLTKVSGIPMLERAADKKWGGDARYEAYKRRVPCLIPRLFSKPHNG